MTPAERKEIVYATAQLRHLYENLMAGAVRQPQKLAQGLVAPQIRRLERLTTEHDG